MKLETKSKYWKFLPVGGKNIKQYVYQEEGQRLRFTENPEDPAYEISSFFKNNSDFTLLIMPPCSRETAEFATEHFKEVIFIDYNKERLCVFAEETNGIYRTHLVEDELSLREVLSEFANELNFGKTTSFIPVRYARLDHQLRCLLKEDLLKIQQEYCSFAVNRSLKNWHRTLNAVENIKNIKESVLSLPNIKGQDAVIVGAGPSLDDTVGKLYQYRNSFYIIATDGSLKSLLRNDIIPDLIVSCEDTVMSWQFFTGYLERLEDVPLIAPFNANHYLMKHYPGPICLTKNNENNSWCQNIVDSLPLVSTGRCVGHMAFNLAIAIGAGRIIMTGFDLAFKGEVFHPKDMAVPYFHEMDVPVPVTVKSIYGEDIRTDLSMRTYLKDFEYMIDQTALKVIDATEGGALITGTEIKSLVDLEFIGSKKKLEVHTEPNKLLKKFTDMREAQSGFYENLALNFTSFLVQNSEDISENDKLSDRNSAFELLESLLIKNDCNKDNTEALLLPEVYSKTEPWFIWALENNIKLISAAELSSLLRQVKLASLSHLYCVNGEIPPDIIALTDLSCTDIKTNNSKTVYERSLWLKKYSVLTGSSSLDFWNSTVPDHVTVKQFEPLNQIEKVANGN